MRDLVEIEVFAPLKPPITRLIEALRGPEPSWWNFGSTRTCAFQVAVAAGILNAEAEWGDLGVKCGEGAVDIMTCVRAYTKKQIKQIRPRDVAAALEHYRDTGQALSPSVFVQQERG